MSLLERIVLPNIRHGQTPLTALAGLLLTAVLVGTMLIVGFLYLRDYRALTIRGRTASVLVVRVNNIKGGPTANVRYLTGPVGHEALLERLPSPPPRASERIDVRFDPQNPGVAAAMDVGLFPTSTVMITSGFVVIGSVVLLAEWRLWRRLGRTPREELDGDSLASDSPE